MPVTRADLLTRLRNPTKATAEIQRTILLTSATCADMKEAAEMIERLRAALKPFADPTNWAQIGDQITWLGESTEPWDIAVAALQETDVEWPP